MQWIVRLLGSPEIAYGDKVISRFESSRVMALVARLVLRPRQIHPREELIDALWPEVEVQKGRQRLRQTLFSLRQQLRLLNESGEDLIIVSRLALRINLGLCTSDVWDFERAIKRGDISAAREGYRGPLLPGWYDEWVLEERDRLEILAEDPMDPGQSGTKPLTVKNASIIKFSTKFVGRDEALIRLRDALETSRLLTLVGLGGIGKTRMACEFSRTAPFDSVRFIDLSACSDWSEAVRLIHRIFGLLADGEGHPDGRQFCFERTLLILDNCDGLASSDDHQPLEGLLSRNTFLHLLLTSRFALGLPSESVFTLGSLSEEATVELFLDRCQDIRPGYHLSKRNAEPISSVCRALEGIPLAVEIAASRIRAITPAQMSKQLGDRLEWLAMTGHRAELAGRHRSLVATLAMSWEKLAMDERALLSALTIFKGPFTEDQAKGVLGGDEVSAGIRSLLRKSLLQSDGAYYRILETVGTFSRSRLPYDSSLRARYRKYFLETPSLDANNGAAWMSAVEDQDGESSYRFAIGLKDGCIPLIGSELAWKLICQTLKLPPTVPLQKQLAISLAIDIAIARNSRSDARQLAELATREAGTDGELNAWAGLNRSRVGLAFHEAGEDQLALLEEVMRLSKSKELHAIALRRIGIVYLRAHDLERAEHSFKASQSIFEALGDERNTRYALANRAQVLDERGQATGAPAWFGEALELYSQALSLARLAGDLVHECKLLVNIGSIYGVQRRWGESFETNCVCLKLSLQIGLYRSALFAMWNISEPIFHRGQAGLALEIMACAAHLWVAEYGKLSPKDEVEVERLMLACQPLMSADQIAGHRQIGARLDIRQAFALICPVPS